MSTRSLIGIRDEDGSCRVIYCHHDGYLSGVGRYLARNWNSLELAESLLAMGGMSGIGANLEECVFYVRDRGEAMSDNAPVSYPSVHKMAKVAGEEWGAEYVYIFSDGCWWLVGRDGKVIEPMKVEAL